MMVKRKRTEKSAGKTMAKIKWYGPENQYMFRGVQMFTFIILRIHALSLVDQINYLIKRTPVDVCIGL
jgi:hypothetical protein